MGHRVVIGIVALAFVTTSCKSANPRSDNNNLQSVNASPWGLTAAQNKIVGKYLIELATHVNRFGNDPQLRERLQTAMKDCDEQSSSSNPQPEAEAIAPHAAVSFQSLKPCGRIKQKFDRGILEALRNFQKSPAFDAVINQMLEEVLPVLFDKLFDQMEQKKGPALDAATSDIYLNALNSIAIQSQQIAEKFSWRPGYLIASRYLHQIVLSELSKSDFAEIDWDLVKEAVDMHMKVSPFPEGDLGVLPVVVSFKSPLYKTLFGPTPRGSAYWLMKATVSLRLDLQNDNLDTFGFSEHRYLKTVLEQIALESPSDQDVIARGIAHLTEKAVAGF